MGGDDYCGTCGSTEKTCARCARAGRAFNRDDVTRLRAAAQNCRATADHARDVFNLPRMSEALSAATFYDSLAERISALLSVS